MNVDHALRTVASVLFDAVYIPGGEKSAATLADEPDAIEFVNEAFRHCKAIAGKRRRREFLKRRNLRPQSERRQSRDLERKRRKRCEQRFYQSDRQSPQLGKRKSAESSGLNNFIQIKRKGDFVKSHLFFFYIKANL